MIVSAAHARRFLVARHHLAPARALPPTPASILAVVDRFGALQFDPLEAPGARNHDLVLHARIAGYRRGLCEELLYPSDAPGLRLLYETYNKSLNVVPIDEVPFHRAAWTKAESPRSHALLQKHRRAAAAIVARLAEEGALFPDAFDREKRVIGYWGTTTSLSRHLLEALFVVGRVGIARREGNRRCYDLAERLLPAALLDRRVDKDEARRHRLLTRHRAVGLMGESSATELITGTGTAAQRKTSLARLVDEGALSAVEVEGLKGRRHVLASDRALLDATRTPRAGAPTATFLAPLDPLMWDRRLVRDLFGFEYTWEVYTPEAKRTHGYYVLPILFGDRIVGRIEPKVDRATRTLKIVGLWLEDGTTLDDDGLVRAIGEALVDYAAFVGAERSLFPRTKIGRELARGIARET
ncbi:MAG: DNA glycosylase AlkZ-like family protein [Polyangiales bacterium]